MENSEKKIFINKGTEEETEIKGYIQCKYKQTIAWIFIVFSFGLLRLLFYWKPDYMLKLTHKKAALKNSTKVLLTDKYSQMFVETIKQMNEINVSEIFSCNESNNKELNEKITEKDSFLINYSLKYFIHKKWKYIWNFKQNHFMKLNGLEENYPIYFFEEHKGWYDTEINNKIKIFGKNSIQINLTSLHVLLVREILTPFYIFQIFSVTLWCFESYYYFAACIFLISLVSIVYSLYSLRRNEKVLLKMISINEKINVFRLKKYPSDALKYKEFSSEIDCEYLVPGDIIEIKNFSTMHCDALLLNGNVIVNESLLTGESLAVTKIGLKSDGVLNSNNSKKLNFKEHKLNILYSGTQVIQTRIHSDEKVKAIVLRTGFNTTKGELLRSILHPKPSEFRFDSDLYKYMLTLGFLAIIGIIFSVYIKIKRKYPILEIVLKSLDLISIVVPPALPGALTACLMYAQNRLKNKMIFCISPSSINVSGSLNTFVFDKTGIKFNLT